MGALLGFGAILGAIIALSYAMGVITVTNKEVKRRLVEPARSHSGAQQAQTAPVVRFQNTTIGLGRYLNTASGLAKLDRNLMLAGRPEGWSVAKVVMYKTIGVGLGVFLLISLVSKESTIISWGTGIGALIFGFFAPEVLIVRRAEARQKAIQRELPDVLDQVTIAIESGLGFEAAFAHIGQRRTGPLADEVVRTVQDMRLGMSRKEAYQALADRTDVPDLAQFVRSVIQAEQYGVSVATVVRTQAEEIRFSRRKRAEAAALKVPVKIVFPLLVCILPVLFAVILTPAVIALVDTFSRAGG